MSAKKPLKSARPLKRRMSPAKLAPTESQRHLELAIRASQAGLWDWNPATQECHYSPEWKNQIGAAGEPLSHQLSEWESRLHPEDHDRVMAEMQAGLAKPPAELELEFRLRHKDGSYRWIHMWGQTFRDAAGKAVRVAGCQLDVTERKSLETKFQQAQKMEAVGRLASGVAHDFNNLLTIILGYSEMLLRAPALDDHTRGSLTEIKKAGERAFSLTRQLLTFSRKQPFELSRLDLNLVVGDCEKLLKRLLGEDVELSIQLAPDIGQVQADFGQLEQVLMNLAINARDAMPEGGKLTIETAGVSLSKAYCRKHAGVKPGRYILLAVKDTGSGMDEATKAQIFEPFFTTKEEGKGTGLGLSMVFNFIKQSGGHVSVLSKPGLGTTFKILIPEAEALSAPALSGINEQGLCSGWETILLVEDDDGVRALARKILQDQGYTVLDTNRGEAALALAKSHPSPIHVLVSDVVMPGMSGHRLAGDVETVQPGIKTLFISGYADDTVLRYGILSSETAFLQKPFTIEALPLKVRQVLDQ